MSCPPPVEVMRDALLGKLSIAGAPVERQGPSHRHGAATIVNAIALGQGAAFGVDLWTKAEVQLTDNPLVVKGEITSDQSESTL